MLRSLAFLLLCAVALSSCNETAPAEVTLPTGRPVAGIDSTLEAQRTPDSDIQAAFDNNTSNLQVLVRGVVDRHLADDLEGDKHQKFILRLASGQTLLVAHNIDLAPRVPAASLAKTVYVYGEYEWNAQGGVVHWTHRDPDGSHAHGWIQFDGTRYE
jgi:hypothetical protein